MAAQHYRKIELQSPADFTYLYGNTVALSRQKLDLSLPPSATNDDTPDPMRERVQELVDDVSDQSCASIAHRASCVLDYFLIPKQEPASSEKHSHEGNTNKDIVHKPHIHNSFLLNQH